ncbi:DUF2934 domain-containing protein [uncultured Sphingomonas sp.]|uniref:DUF2934 domain-containing protein n=1 Tax=uncultured Sphingomonas sp. TaxID=158754 RepID=UPI002634C253|nr:DUF2934 domain-containing protein [uncultured Sphingomonas sp.]
MAEREKKVRDRAYALWQAEGEPHGRDQHHWSQAELELGADDADAAAEPADSPAADTPLTDTQASAPAAAEPADSPAASKARATPARKPRKPRAKQA